MAFRAVVGIGANLGDRLATMREAARRIDGAAPIRARSRVYETAPVGGPAQPPFLNAAVLVAFDGSALELLDSLLGIEASLGRVRTEHWGPRIIDLDVLWIRGIAVDLPGLVVPHPRLRERAFALRPLLDVAPDARDPRSAAPYVVPTGDVRDAGEVL